jgi:cytochrome oxidase assembly protein ShyY1
MIGVYQGIIVAILLPFGLLNANEATAYALLVFAAQLAVWAILGIWGIRRTDLKVKHLAQGSFEENEL